MSRTSILIVDDHPTFRQGIRQLLEQGERFQVVAEAGCAYECLELAELHQPQVILLDVQLRGLTGLTVAPFIRKRLPASRLMFLTMQFDDERLFEAARAGAAAYLTKDVEPEVLLEAIDQVAAGEQPIHAMLLQRPWVAARVLEELRTRTTGRLRLDGIQLTTREIEVIDCLAQGYSNRDVAEALFLTEQTVKNHLTSILRKLMVGDRMDILRYAILNGWAEIGTPSTDA